MQPAAESKVALQAWVSADLARQLRELAAANYRSASAELGMAVREHLAEQKAKS